LAPQKREYHREYNRMSQDRGDAGLTRAKEATRTWGDGKKETWTQRDEERGGYEEVGLCEHDTHRPCNEAEHKEEHESVEKNSHFVGFAVHKFYTFTRGGNEYTWA
tara:strand:- start:26 stop:343 length:318 start_codon:yes stop_codon:yes gene_type:complete